MVPLSGQKFRTQKLGARHNCGCKSPADRLQRGTNDSGLNVGRLCQIPGQRLVIRFWELAHQMALKRSIFDADEYGLQGPTSVRLAPRIDTAASGSGVDLSDRLIDLSIFRVLQDTVGVTERLLLDARRRRRR